MNKDNKKSSELADRHYQPEDYQKKDEISAGLAVTHEQVSDAYMEGEIQPVIDNLEGEDVSIERKGYES